MQWRDQEFIRVLPPQQSPKARRCRQGIPSCVDADFPSRQLKREQRSGRTRESSGNAGAGRQAAGSHANSSPRQEVSILAIQLFVCVCVCVSFTLRRLAPVFVCVNYPTAPGPRNPMGHRINLNSPATVPSDLLPSSTQLLEACCRDRTRQGTRAAQGTGKLAPPPRLGKLILLLTRDQEPKFPNTHTRWGEARAGLNTPRSPRLPWAPQPLHSGAPAPRIPPSGKLFEVPEGSKNPRHRRT